MFEFFWPHSVLSQVGSNAGIVGMTKEHLGLALALNVPVFVVVTKIDMCPSNILQGRGEKNQLINLFIVCTSAQLSVFSNRHRISIWQYRLLNLPFVQSEATERV